MSEISDIKEAWAHFQDFQHVFLATVEGNHPRVRPVTLVYFENRFWITTETKSAKVKQVENNPKVNFAYCSKRRTWIVV
jgi:uncharacterized pyridoxamine 5'-phosphate oxidase family protein